MIVAVLVSGCSRSRGVAGPHDSDSGRWSVVEGLSRLVLSVNFWTAALKYHEAYTKCGGVLYYQNRALNSMLP